ncbi:MAG: alpha/beta hydrolase [Burkholderiaceae bacterium]|nr:alpha/beta hydrolase [Burkholderiaceae bacterium]
MGDLVWHRWLPPGHAPAPGAPPLVLLHGGSGSWTHWVKNIAPLLDAGRTVLAPDMPGFGQSPLPADGADADSMAAPLIDGLRALLGQQGQAVCDLAGFSFGGLTAALMLAQAPQLARRLVLVGAPAMGVAPDGQYTLQAWRHLPTAHAQLAAHRHNLGALMLHDKRLIDDVALQIHVHNVQRDRAPRYRRRLARTDILARTLPAIACPVYAIYGEHDAIYRNYLPALEAAYIRNAPTLRKFTLIAGAGHWVQYEAPGAFLGALLAALDGA